MKTLCIGCVLFLAVASVGSAQDLPADQAQAIKSLMERVAALEREVQDLRRQNQQPARAPATTPAVEAPAPAPAEPAVVEHQHDVAPQPDNSETYPTLKIRGFGNVDYEASDSAAQPSGFTVGQFVMHFSSALSPKTSFFGELSFTAQQTAYNADVERAIIRYDLNDFLKVSFGRYHAPVNYWNTAYHHGAWLQTTISRPEMIRFGGRLLPVHFVGGLAEGSIPSGSLGLNYNVGVGNGRQTITQLGRDGDAGDVNRQRAFVASLFARPSSLYGFQAGGSIYIDKISPDATSVSKNTFQEWIASGHVAYTKESPEFLAEFSNVRHHDTFTNKDWDSQAGYAQLAYRLPGDAHMLKPYYRFEFINIPAGEPVLLIPGLDGGHTLGTRWDITDFAGFKFEYRYWKRSDTDHFNGFFAQTAFTF